MPDRVRGVVTADSARDIGDLINGACRSPVALLGLLIAESGLRERAARQGIWPDWSAGLAQQTLKWYGREAAGVATAADGTGLPSAANWTAFCAWFFRAEHAVPSAGRVLDGYLRVAASVLGEADPRVPLAACCLWNAPNLGSLPSGGAVLRWLSPDLQSLDAKHAANRENYRRGLAAAEQYRVEDDPMPTDQQQPAFRLGFKDYADAHPEVGSPLENEHYLAGDDHYSLQMTDGGLLVYSREANAVQFHPKG